MIVLLATVVLVIQTASGRLIARHGGHDAAPSALSNNTTMPGFAHPTGTYTTYNSVSPFQSAISSNTDIHTYMTATAIPPTPSSTGSRAPYANVTSTGSLEHGLGAPVTSPFSATASSVTDAWDELWSLHWPASSTTNSSIAAITTTATVSDSSISLSTTTARPAIPYLTARPTQPSAQSSITAIVVPIATMSTSSLSRYTVLTLDNALVDPILFDPGRLSSSKAQTSTIQNTVTASIPELTPTISPLKKSIITSKITGTLTKTVKLSSTSAQPSSPPSSVRPSSAPQSSLTPSLSITQQSNDPVIYTSVISADIRCPYPLPGVYYAEPKTTLITETRSGEASMASASMSTSAEGKPKETGWCPYPGMKC